jgi:hypothetical protein
MQSDERGAHRRAAAGRVMPSSSSARSVLPAAYFALTVEIGDVSRLTGASIGAYVGLVPTEYS